MRECITTKKFEKQNSGTWWVKGLSHSSSLAKSYLLEREKVGEICRGFLKFSTAPSTFNTSKQKTWNFREKVGNCHWEILPCLILARSQ
jgi:hypothetical protein